MIRVKDETVFLLCPVGCSYCSLFGCSRSLSVLLDVAAVPCTVRYSCLFLDPMGMAVCSSVSMDVAICSSVLIDEAICPSVLLDLVVCSSLLLDVICPSVLMIASASSSVLMDEALCSLS